MTSDTVFEILAVLYVLGWIRFCFTFFRASSRTGENIVSKIKQYRLEKNATAL